MNTKGIKFLAVLAVLAMAFAACAVIAYSDENDAAMGDTSAKWNAGGAATMGPLDFAAAEFTYGGLGFDNEDLSNDIVVTYDVNTKTYTVTGTLGWNANSNAETDVLKKLGMPSTDHYALAFLAVYDGKNEFQVKVGDIGKMSDKKTANEDCILSMNKVGTSTVTIVGGDYEGIYTIDFTGVTLSPSAEKNPKVPFVGLNGYNEAVAINVTGDYVSTSGTGNNKKLGNSVTITEVDKTSADLFAEYTIYAKLAYNDFKADAKGMDYHGEDLRYALVWQITGLKAFDNNLGISIPDGMGWNTGEDKKWYHAVASEASNTQESIAYYYKDVASISPGTVYLYFGPREMPTQADVGDASCIKINIEIEMIKKDQVVNTVADAKTQLAKEDVTEVELSVGDADMPLGTDLVVETKKVFILSANGTGKVNGDITVGKGTDAQKITLTDFKGTVEIAMGSVMILANPWSAGTITLHDGDVVKLSGEITGAVIFTYEGTKGSAKILVEADTVLDIKAAASLTVNSDKIAVEIEGTVEGAGTLNVAAAKSLTVKDGGVLSVTSVTSAGAGKNIVYSGGDINDAGITAEDIVKWIGKDAASGTWSYTGTVLTLNNYNGTYNFGKIPTGITKIELKGDNVVTVKAPVERTAVIDAKTVHVLFGGTALTSITTDSAGSLSIVADISDVEGIDLNKYSAVIAGTALEINGVGIGIYVDGSNTTWTDEQKKDIRITGIGATTSLEFFDAPTVVKIMPDYDSEELTGIYSKATLKITGKGMIVEAATAIDAILDDTTIKTAVIEAKGNAELKNITVSNASEFNVDGLLTAANITISQETQLTIKDAKVSGKLDNKGSVTINGNVMVTPTGAIENHATIENNGFIGVYGKFSNDSSVTTVPAAFTNNGTLAIFAMKENAGKDDAALTIADVAPTSDSNAVLTGIAIDNAKMQYDGSFAFDATITVITKAGAKAIDDEFTGNVMPAINGGYSLTMSSKTATITVVFDPEKDGGDVIGKKYTVAVTGSVKAGANTFYLQANTADKAVAPDTIKENADANLIVKSGADFDITAGVVHNEEGNIIVSSSVASGEPVVPKDVLIYADATFHGNLITRIADVTIKGAFNGNLTAAGEGVATVANFNGNILSMGSVVVSASKTMVGDIIAKKDVTVSGDLVGNITTDGNTIDIKNMIGKITVDRHNEDIAAKTVNITGTVIVELVYNSFYKETTTATEPKMFTAVMDIAGVPNGLILDLTKGSDATASADAVAGYFRINATGALDENKTVGMGLKEGRILVDSVTTLEARYYLTIEAGATIEVNKSAASLDVKKAALKVSKDANALFEVGPATPVNYGKVYFVMAFEIDGGEYTIYSDVAYALLNCNENTELYVGESATIDQDVVVKAGVNIVVEDITLTFNGKDVEMLEGAMITIEGTGKVIFKETGSDVASIKKDETITYYTVCATIVYGDNSVTFDEARFTEDSTIQGVAATSTAAAKIKTDFAIESGKATVNGLGTGSIALVTDIHDVTKESADPETFCVFGTFVVGADAVFDAVNLVDAPAMVLYKAVTGGFEVKEIVRNPTIVGVEGTLNLLNDTTVLGGYIGYGHVTLAANKSLTVDSGAVPAVTIDPIAYPASLNTYVVDTTDDANGYLFNFTSPVAGNDDNNLILKAEKVTISGEKVDAVTIKGTAGANSIIKAVDDAFISGLDLYDGAVIYGENVYILGASTTEHGGSVGAKAIFMDEAPFADLVYQTVFMEEEYYIYAMFNAIDWDEVTDLDLVINKGIVNINQKLDLSGKDVNIVIGEKATFNVNNVVIIGTPATVLGDEGSSIIGKIIIKEDAKAYLVAYADVDLTLAEIVSAEAGNPDAVFSKLDIEDVVYAAIFASNQGDDPIKHVILAKADAALVPEIVGYNFTSWLNYNGDSKAEVGETNAYADAKAVYLTVIVKYVAGVDYYMNGLLFNVYDIPTDVPYGSYFTAKISDTTKYQGNPLINGEKTVCVYDDMELVASGVTPIPEPAPEPVVGDSGLSLTDILLIVLVILIAIMVVILVLRLNRS